MTSETSIGQFRRALPFWLSLTLVPLAVLGATQGGWALFLLPISAWHLMTLLDFALGMNDQNLDPDTSDDQLYWYRFVTMLWPWVQAILLAALLYYVPRADHLVPIEKLGAFFGMGVLTGTVGIVYAHELMHQSSRVERWLGDILMAMACYGHFRSEHLLVHHTHVGTPRDAVTARYNESFPSFFVRVLPEAWRSAFRVERDRLARKGLRWTHVSNPFWRYWALQVVVMGAAVLIGGWVGLGLFLFQAFIAVWQLELVNYIEHYGLTRKHLGDGKFERAQPHHSWNAAHRASNWLLINLQRHSDHHVKPNRRYPLLQTHGEEAAPQLPYGYPMMTVIAMIPPLWRRMMNQRVRKWRADHYPEVRDWTPYSRQNFARLGTT